jgi:16S rRNA (cytosine967-C5)-methyltransferase
VFHCAVQDERRTTALWTEWLGPKGKVPPPLDWFLAMRRADRSEFVALTAAAATVVTTCQALTHREPPPGGIALLDELRDLEPNAVLARRGVEVVRRKLRDDPRWEARCVSRGIPSGWAAPLARRATVWGEERALAWLAGQSKRPPLWLRARDPKAVKRLLREGFQVHAEGLVLRVEGEAGISSTAAYQEGLVEVQDLASQRAGAEACPKPGQVAWDVCAGRGGKTVQLADALHGKGAVHATDTDSRKLVELRKRVKRAGHADHVRVRAWDGVTVPDFGPEARDGFDVVLVDAPCSSSGTWRRNPDARLRIDPAEAPRFAEVQRRLLALAATAVRPGGRLVYVTCSWLVEEDEDVVQDLLPGARTAHHGPPDLDSDTLFVAVSER